MTPRLERCLILTCFTVSLASTVFVLLIAVWIILYAYPLTSHAGHTVYESTVGVYDQVATTEFIEPGLHEVAPHATSALGPRAIPSGHTLECIERDASGQMVGVSSSSSSSSSSSGSSSGASSERPPQPGG